MLPEMSYNKAVATSQLPGVVKALVVVPVDEPVAGGGAEPLLQAATIQIPTIPNGIRIAWRIFLILL